MNEKEKAVLAAIRASNKAQKELVERAACPACRGKGYYSQFHAGGRFGDSFDGHVTIQPKIENHPCKKCAPAIPRVDENPSNPEKSFEDTFPLNTFFGETKSQLIRLIQAEKEKSKMEAIKASVEIIAQEEGAGWREYTDHYLKLITEKLSQF